MVSTKYNEKVCMYDSFLFYFIFKKNKNYDDDISLIRIQFLMISLFELIEQKMFVRSVFS